MPPLVYIPQPVDEEALALLQEEAEVVVGYGPEGRPLRSLLPEVMAFLVRTEPLSAETIEAAPSLKVIARHGVGVDNIAVEAATRKGIPVLITPEANLRSVAEHVFALALAVSRKVTIADHMVRNGGFTRRDELIGRELSGARLGVVGLGRVGREVCKIGSQGFGMEVSGYDPHLSDKEVAASGTVPVSSLQELLSKSDYVSVHVPLSAETQGLIGERELAYLGRDSILIQTSRGGVVDEQALVRALHEGQFAGAGIDVYEEEPPPEDHPFFSMERVVLTPHTAAHTRQAMRRMALDAARGILDILGGPQSIADTANARWQVVNPGCAVAANRGKGS